MSGDQVACATVVSNLYVYYHYIVLHTSAVLFAIPAATSDFRNFNNGVCNVKKITAAEVILTWDS